MFDRKTDPRFYTYTHTYPYVYLCIFIYIHAHIYIYTYILMLIFYRKPLDDIYKWAKKTFILMQENSKISSSCQLALTWCNKDILDQKEQQSQSQVQYMIQGLIWTTMSYTIYMFPRWCQYANEWQDGFWELSKQETKKLCWFYKDICPQLSRLLLSTVVTPQCQINCRT